MAARWPCRTDGTPAFPTTGTLTIGLTLLPDAYQLHQALGRAQVQRGAVADAIRGYENALRLNTKKTDAARRDYETATKALADLRDRKF